MDYSSAIAISAAGMEVQRTRLDVAAINIANVSTTKSINGGPYVPFTAVTKIKKSSTTSSNLPIPNTGLLKPFIGYFRPF